MHKVLKLLLIVLGLGVLAVVAMAALGIGWFTLKPA